MPATRTATESDQTATISILNATIHPTAPPNVAHVTTAGHRAQEEPRTSLSTPLDRPTQTCPKFLLLASSISIPNGAPSTTVPSHPVLSTTLPEPLGPPNGVPRCAGLTSLKKTISIRGPCESDLGVARPHRPPIVHECAIARFPSLPGLPKWRSL